ncbi:MAG: acyltransferase family protein, partial [Muribaculaceae bacterium]|nr:acyltransferase family protein [Muribaculaceae bacterium]
MNPVIAICKGIAIILVVMGHAEPPTLLSNFIYIFHMPLFFMTAGYFFNLKYLNDPWTFCTKRFKGLYIPFLKWSIVFLLLHNLWFDIGLLNEQYGNWEGGVTHPYNLRQFFHRLFLIITSMSGYDEFLAGAFWFFRGLLVASIMFLVLFKIVDSSTKLSPSVGVVIVCLLALGFNAYRLGFGFKISTIPNGGLREVWGMFFFGLGFLYRYYESKIGNRWWLTILCFSIMCIGAWNHWCGMNNNGQLRDLVTLPLTGVAGFIVIKHLSSLIVMCGGIVSRSLAYIGNNTLYVFIFHIISYKPVSALKIWWYGLDPAQIGSHMVIHYNNHEDLFWLLYTIVGSALPLTVLWLWRKHGVSRFPRPKFLISKN